MSSGGFHLARRPNTVREPDVASVRAERLPASGVPDGFWPGPADLAIEIRSPGDRRSEIDAKVNEYFGRGVRLVWVEHEPSPFINAISRRSCTERNATLDGGTVVPGFSCPLGKFFK